MDLCDNKIVLTRRFVSAGALTLLFFQNAHAEEEKRLEKSSAALPVYMFCNIALIDYGFVDKIEKIFSLLIMNVPYKISEIYILLASNGGQVNASLAIYNTLRNLEYKITTVNMSNVDSAATIIYLCGSTRIALPNSTFRFHSVSSSNFPNKMNESDLKDRYEGVKRDNDTYSRIYSERAGLSLDQARQLLNGENVVTADEAQKLGIVTEITQLKLPYGKMVFTDLTTYWWPKSL